MMQSKLSEKPTTICYRDTFFQQRPFPRLLTDVSFEVLTQVRFQVTNFQAKVIPGEVSTFPTNKTIIENSSGISWVEYPKNKSSK